MIDLSPACQRMIDVLTGITDDQLVGATPCDDFTVADLLSHANASAIRLGALARREGAEEPGDSSRELVGQHVHALATAWQERSAWQGTTDVGIELTNEVWGRIALHGWDLAPATGQPFELPEGTLQAVWGYLTEFLPTPPEPSGPPWGAVVPLPPDATLLDHRRDGRPQAVNEINSQFGSLLP